jgi:putative NADH-flavin reductase
MTERKVVALVGASGFVGSAVKHHLEQVGHFVRPIKSPRLMTGVREVTRLIEQAQTSVHAEEIAVQLRGVDAVVNAAGNPDASSPDADALFGANALLPRIVAEASSAASVPRMIHVSSAVVQNDRPVLDESEELFPFSPYSASKVAGEEVLRMSPVDGSSVTRYRPPSVHALSRRVTRRVAKIASSPLASVAAPGTQPSPQALLTNVAAAIGYLATCEPLPPPVVVHPWEGLTAEDVMLVLGGGRKPKRLPQALARALVTSARLAGRAIPPAASNARRVELLWLGQRQAASWLTSQGWAPPEGIEAWRELGKTVSDSTSRS